jgi:hypothetical protein
MLTLKIWYYIVACSEVEPNTEQIICLRKIQSHIKENVLMKG